jgi:hypothetical protein
MRVCLFLLVSFLLTPLARGQVLSPPPPANYHVDLRYRIDADRDGRVRIFRAMMAELNTLGFVADPREDADLDILNPNADRMPGVIPGANAAKLNQVTAVQSVLLRNAEAKPVDDIAKLVRVGLTLAAGYDADQQRQLHEQCTAQLAGLGFKPAPGYDHRGFTHLRGSLPAGNVLNLLKDLRGQPAGVFLPVTPRDKLPKPLAYTISPVRTIEVLPDLEAVPAAPVPPTANAKFSSDLQAALTDVAFTGKGMRVEAALVQPIANLREFRFQLKSKVPKAMLDGIVGPMVTFFVPTVADLVQLAALPDVLALRLPPAGAVTVFKGTSGAGDALAATNIAMLQAQGYRGAGRTIVVVASNFSDVTGLPSSTRRFDLTGELSPTNEPTPLPKDDDGGPVAKAVHAAAPEASLVLVRIEPRAFHQLMTVARAVKGDLTLSHAQVSRAETMLDEYNVLNLRRDIVTTEYTQAMGNLSDDDKPRIRREKAIDALAKFKKDEAEFRVRYDRLNAVRSGLEALAGATAVVNTITWDDGYPLDGLSEFSQFLAKEFVPGPARSALKQAQMPLLPTWIQAASESAWSVWTGPASDADGNRVMEFAPPHVPVKQGLWNRELNVLGILKRDGGVAYDLPEAARLRIVIQWREPRDPTAPVRFEPLVAFNLNVLRQFDPAGKQAATDDLAIVAQSTGKPVRLLMTESSTVYEQMVEFTAPAAGRYAVQATIIPAVADRFAAETRIGEIAPKITLHTLSGIDGRAAFTSYLVTNGGVGIAGDSPGAFTVGRSTADGQSISLLGAGPGLSLAAKPDVLFAGDFAGHTGSGISAAFAAGLAACLAELSARPAHLVGTTAIAPNAVLTLPPDWVQSLPRPQIALSPR